MKKIHAPYNFVPLSNKIVIPTWGKQVSHDIPFEDGLSSVLQFSIKTDTPLLVGDVQERKGKDEPTVVKPYQLPGEGKYAIPGTSIRGMVRNVLEIASFGKMQRVDDKRYSIRDLTDGAKPIYRDNMKNQQAGWLFFDTNDQAWKIRRCEYERIYHKEISSKVAINWANKKVMGTGKPRYLTPKEKYEIYLATPLSLNIYFDLSSGNLVLNSGGTYSGILIFTGQPNTQKKREFVFYDGISSKVYVVDRVDYADFKFIYQDSEHLDYLQKLHKTSVFPKGIPVFFITKNDKVKSLGLSQMYKLAYQHTVHDAIKTTNPGHLTQTDRDLAELIFGFTDDSDVEQSLKGRVSFPLAVCQKENVKLETCNTILNSPKPSYYPNYISQNEDKGKTEKYSTFMDDNAKLRGWKRYPVRPPDQQKPPTPGIDQGRSVQSEITALESGLEFTGKMRFHNLKPVELGALLWAMEWGGNATLRHGIGMGKPFGYGQISIQIKVAESDIIPNKPDAVPPTLQECKEAYERLMMEQDIPGTWVHSEQLYQLMAMADPQKAPGKPGKLAHMKLKDYADAKKDHLVLMQYADTPKKNPYVKTEIKSSPAAQWLQGRLDKLAGKHNTPVEQVLYGKVLAAEWEALMDEELKNSIRNLVRQRWSSELWNSPQGRATKKARKIYGDDTL